MGTDEWFPLAYKPTAQLSFFGNMEGALERQNYKLAENLTAFYKNRLKTRCFPFVSRPVIMRNSSGGPLYALILASHKELAVRKMHEIFDRRERKSRPKAH
jgi:hypothetical protein